MQQESLHSTLELLGTLALASLSLSQPESFAGGGVRVRALVWLRGLSWFDCERVTDEEQIAALRLSARSLVTQQAILSRSTTDRMPPPAPAPVPVHRRAIALRCSGAAARALAAGGRAADQRDERPAPGAPARPGRELAVQSAHSPLGSARLIRVARVALPGAQVTTLAIDGQLLTHLTNLERMSGLRWASFADNDIFRVDVRPHPPIPYLRLLQSPHLVCLVQSLDAVAETLEQLNLADNYLSRLVGVGAPGERSSRQARHSARSAGAARLRSLNVARNLLAGALDSHSLLVVFAPTLVCLNIAGEQPRSSRTHFLSLSHTHTHTHTQIQLYVVPFLIAQATASLHCAAARRAPTSRSST